MLYYVIEVHGEKPVIKKVDGMVLYWNDLGDCVVVKNDVYPIWGGTLEQLNEKYKSFLEDKKQEIRYSITKDVKFIREKTKLQKKRLKNFESWPEEIKEKDLPK